MVRVLVADDEQDLVWALRHTLRGEGYEVLVAYNGLEALALAQQERPDLVILDVMMPGLDGLDVCRRLRGDPVLAAVPVLFLTVRSSIEQRVEGLDEGSDDYLVKPFDMRELKARVRALLRRSRRATGQARAGAGQDSVLVVGSLSLDLNKRHAIVGGKNIKLTPIEFGILRHLMLHADQVFSSPTLLQEVWGYTHMEGSPSVVRWHIMNLRAKIEPDPAHPLYIRTVPGHGYMLVSDV